MELREEGEETILAVIITVYSLFLLYSLYLILWKGGYFIIHLYMYAYVTPSKLLRSTVRVHNLPINAT